MQTGKAEDCIIVLQHTLHHFFIITNVPDTYDFIQFYKHAPLSLEQWIPKVLNNDYFCLYPTRSQKYTLGFSAPPQPNHREAWFTSKHLLTADWDQDNQWYRIASRSIQEATGAEDYQLTKKHFTSELEWKQSLDIFFLSCWQTKTFSSSCLQVNNKFEYFPP